MKGADKTNAARILDRMGIAYEMVTYDVDPDNLAAGHVAESLGEPIERVYKTLALHGDRTGVIVCVVAGDREVDLKKAAKASGNKKVEMLAMKDLLATTGYIRGGCSPLGMKRHYPTYLSAEALGFDFIYVSGGRRGLQLRLSPSDLLKAADAVSADIATDKP